MELTKAQRHRIFKQALEVVNKKISAGHESGLCLILADLLPKVRGKKVYFGNCSYYLPEFKEPNKTSGEPGMWWNNDKEGDKARIKYLKERIKLTAPKKRKS